MRIICLEEHTSDPTVALAAKLPSLAHAPYITGVGRDYHDHPEPPDRPRLLAAHQATELLGQPLADRLPAMDAAGIDVQVVSLGSAPQLIPLLGPSLVRGANDRLAQAVGQHPDRFAAFFTLPWQDPDAAVQEAQRCVKELHLPATLLMGRPDGDVMIDDPRFEPVLAKLAELGAPLYIHPGPPLHAVQKPYYGGFNTEVSGRLSLFGWGWHHEAGVQVLRLMLSGALDRHRSLKIISGHWGEMVPFFLQRLDDTIPPAVTGLERTLTQTYRDQVWVTPSGMLNLPHFQFIREVLGSERILFSVDYPFLTMNGARRWLEALPVSEPERLAIASGNAATLLGLR